MERKKVLGLDIGTNSIGAALINIPKDFSQFGEEGKIEWIGSRIIPIDGDYLQKFESGAQAITKAAFRRGKRGSRRLKHRYKLRRTRLIKVFKALKWLDEKFPLDDSRKFKKDLSENDLSFHISEFAPFTVETIVEFEKELGIYGQKSKLGKSVVPEDWIVYFLRKKALTEKITISELVRIIYMLNQRRGFKSSRKDLKTTNVLPYQEFEDRLKRNDFGEEGIETQFVSITKIKSVTFKEEKKDGKGNTTNIYTIQAEDTRLNTWEETRRKEPEWVGQEYTLLVTQKVDKNGKFSQNKPQMPSDDDWALCTTALGEKIQEKDQHPGEYFYEQIKEAYKSKQHFKARQYPVYRWRYQKELKEIWERQCELNPELQKINSDPTILAGLAEILYPTQARNNMSKLAEFKNHDLFHIISNDIIYYQRELRSQKNSIGECRYEKRKGIDGEYYGLKCIPRSSPLCQEFRIWQDIHNIRVLEREQKIDGKTKLDVDVTGSFIDDNVKEKLFDLFNSKASISEKEILKLLKEFSTNSNIKLDIDKKEKIHSHRINLFSRRDELKGNETLSRYRSVFKKAEFDGEGLLNDKEKLLRLWHIDYSITSSDEEKSRKGITTALNKLLPEKFNKEKVIELFTKLSELKKEYGAFSSCAIRKMLPVMRCGVYWNKNDVTESAQKRAEQIIERLEDINHSVRRINEIADDDVQKQVLKSFIGMDNLTKGLNTYQAGYLIYDRHSEKERAIIGTPEELGRFIQKEIPNNSLRNPIVEQVVRETMLLVKDIWKRYGTIDEIHVEIGRDLKNNSVERKKISERQDSNFKEKQKIRKILYELMNDGFSQFTEDDTIEKVNFEINPNPESPADIEKFRIWRSLSNQSESDWAKKVKDEKIPTEQEVKKYTLWLSQNCRSPYTGKIIPLSKLFDVSQYEIEHIIPRARMKNDSFNNLVIAEWGVNKAKDKQLAANFIADCEGKCSYGDKEYKLLTYEEYDKYCSETFKFQKSKRKNLLATEVPDDFVERQLNDTRYIGRKITELLAPVARMENGIIFTGGSITSELRKNWGLNKVWKELMKSRFERLEKITGEQYIVHDTDEYGNPIFHFNVQENEGLNIKRINHRHHALDALIIAVTTREHIRYLNTLNAADIEEDIKKYKLALVKGKIRDFKKPWKEFTKEAKDRLQETIVTFKINNNIISTPKNKTTAWKSENGKLPKKVFKEQTPNKNWMAVRRSMFKEPQGIVFLKEVYEEKNIMKAVEIQIERMRVQNTPAMKTQSYVYDKEARQIIRNLIEKIGIPVSEPELLGKEIKKHLKKNPLKDFSGNEYKSITVARFEEYAAKRVKLDKTFDHKKINKIPYGDRVQTSEDRKLSISQILHSHLTENGDKPDIAFSAEGLDELAKKAGHPITKVTIAEKKDESSKFGDRYVEVDKGGMAYFVIYENRQTKKREGFESIPVHRAIEKIVAGDPIAKEIEGFDKIILSPGDLVYVPTAEEQERILNGTEIGNAIDFIDNSHLVNRIYKVVSFSKKDLLCVKADISDYIIPYNRKEKNKGEVGWDNKSATTMEDDVIIREVCIKLNLDRLGNIFLKTKKKRDESNENIPTLSEPTISYQKSTILKFSSFEEMNQFDAKYAASINPEERLKNTTEIIKRIYEEELKKPADKKLKFRE